MENRYTSFEQVYRDALDIQNASNLSGVAHAFADVCSFLMNNGYDSTTIRRDPAVLLFIDKMADMCSISNLRLVDEYGKWEAACERRCRKEPSPV